MKEIVILREIALNQGPLYKMDARCSIKEGFVHLIIAFSVLIV